MVSTVDFLFDGRQHMRLNADDVGIARLFLEEGVEKMALIRQFRESGWSITQAVAVVNCALQQIQQDS
jgi:hypothetical protein